MACGNFLFAKHVLINDENKLANSDGHILIVLRGKLSYPVAFRTFISCNSLSVSDSEHGIKSKVQT